MKSTSWVLPYATDLIFGKQKPHSFLNSIAYYARVAFLQALLMSSQLNKQPLKHSHAHARWFHGHRSIQIFAGSCAIALIGLVLFKSEELFPVVFPQVDTTTHATKSPHRLDKQVKPRVVTKASKNRHTEAASTQTGLYDLDGNLLGTFFGSFQETTPDGQSVITYDYSEGQSYLSQLDGTEHRALAGIFQGFSPSEQQIITYTHEQSHLYDLDGTLIASLAGQLIWGTLNGRNNH